MDHCIVAKHKWRAYLPDYDQAKNYSPQVHMPKMRHIKYNFDQKVFKTCIRHYNFWQDL